MNVMYARNEFKGVLIRCPHCTFPSRHDPDDIGDAIKEGKPVVCGACDTPFYVFVSAAPRETVEHSVERTSGTDEAIPGVVDEIEELWAGE